MTIELPETNIFHGKRVCGFDDSSLPIGEENCKWPTLDLTWGVNRGPSILSPNDFQQAIADATDIISDACGLQFTYNPNPKTANIVINIFRGSPGGELAHAYLPCGRVNSSSQLQLNFDDTEAYVIANNPPSSKIDIGRVGLHELLHNCGIPHLSGGVAIMNPTYNARIRTLQTLDIAELVRRYGMPRPRRGKNPSSGGGAGSGSGGGGNGGGGGGTGGNGDAADLVRVSFGGGKWVVTVASGVTVKLASGQELVS
jgi:hypothetical protein